MYDVLCRPILAANSNWKYFLKYELSYFRNDFQMLLAATEGKNIVHSVKYSNNKAKTLNLKIRKNGPLKPSYVVPLVYCKANLFEFQCDFSNILGVRKFRTFKVMSCHNTVAAVLLKF